MATALSAGIPKRVQMAILEDGLQRKTKSRPRVAVVITRISTGQLDSDNLQGSVKAILDCLRNCGLIEDDDEESISLEVRPVKAPSRKEQGTLIEITYS